MVTVLCNLIEVLSIQDFNYGDSLDASGYGTIAMKHVKGKSTLPEQCLAVHC